MLASMIFIDKHMNILFFFNFRNSPSGKQYIDNVKHKLIMKISLESVDLAAGK